MQEPEITAWIEMLQLRLKKISQLQIVSPRSASLEYEKEKDALANKIGLLTSRLDQINAARG